MRADGVDMCARLEPCPVNDGLCRRGSQRDNIGVGKRACRARRNFHRHARRFGEPVSERLNALRRVHGEYHDLLQVCRCAHGKHLGTSLHTGPKNRADRRIFPGQMPRRHPGHRAGANRCQIAAVHDRNRLPGVLIEQDDRCQRGGKPELVRIPLVHRHRLRTQGTRRFQIGGHRGDPASHVRVDNHRPVWHCRRPGSKLRKCGLDHVDSVLDVEELLHVSPIQQ